MSSILVKILFIAVVILALIVTISAIFFPKSKPSPAPLPILEIEKASPSPSTYHQTPVQPLPSFTPPTIPYDQLTQQQKEQAQSKADEYYQKTQNQIIQNYPWYLKLPLQDNYYFVYFDVATETFIAKLYPQKSFSDSLDEQTTGLKKTVVEKIKELGSNAKQYKIDWRIIPE